MENVTNMDNSNKSMTMNGAIYSTENPAFCSYLLCASLLIIKMMLTTILVVYHRIKNKTFISPEDTPGWPNNSEHLKLNEDVERVRRAYQNDMENIILFLIISLGYLSVQPPFWAVNTLFFTYLVTRILHTIVYTVYIIRQPARGLLFQIGFIIIGYMSTHTAIHAVRKGYLK